MYNYSIYDLVETMAASSQRALADNSNIIEVIVYQHLESFQNFLIDYKLKSKEVTPLLNSFTKDQNTTYFDHFFEQTGQGKTFDAECRLKNSIVGLPQASVFYYKDPIYVPGGSWHLIGLRVYNDYI